MLTVFTLIAGVVGFSLLLGWRGSARLDEKEEDLYRRNAREEDEWNWGESPDVQIVSTDDHYLHPEQPWADALPKITDDATSKHTW